LGLRFYDVPQYHASPTEIEDKRTQQMNWRGGTKPYWLHGGSLSSGWGGYLTGDTPDTSHEMAKLEIETRCALWSIASEFVHGFDKFKQQYKDGIRDLIVRSNLSVHNIETKINIYRDLMGI
jgi:hypothetical protein